jgi:dsRNA-specific ribonuclease
MEATCLLMALRLIGTIQTTVARLVCNANLMAIGTTEGLGTCVEKNPSQMGEISPQTMTTAVEAIIGAVHLDDGHREDAVRRVMQSLGLVYDIAG